jgi:hypothetical protein
MAQPFLILTVRGRQAIAPDEVGGQGRYHEGGGRLDAGAFEEEQTGHRLALPLTLTLSP